MASRTIATVNSQQLIQLPRQTRKAPPAVVNIDLIDKNTGIASDAFMSAEWDPAEKHCMFNFPVYIKQLETKQVHVQNGGEKMVTNLLVSNGSVFECQLTGWAQYAEQLSGLKQGSVKY